MVTDIQELLQDEKVPIYVRNHAGRFIQDQKGRPTNSTFVLQIETESGKSKPVSIPATKYPYCLSNHVPRKLLADSYAFFDAVQRGILELVDPDQAKRELASPQAQRAQAAAMAALQPRTRRASPMPHVDPGNDSRMPPGAPVGISAGKTMTGEGLGDGSEMLKMADADDGVNPTIKQIVADLHADPDLADELLDRLVGLSYLTAADLGYIMSNCKDFRRVISWAKSELAAMSGEEGEDYDESDQDESDQAEAAPRKKRRKRKK